jgi:hypothetical protein
VFFGVMEMFWNKIDVLILLPEPGRFPWSKGGDFCLAFGYQDCDIVLSQRRILRHIKVETKKVYFKVKQKKGEYTTQTWVQARLSRNSLSALTSEVFMVKKWVGVWLRFALG